MNRQELETRLQQMGDDEFSELVRKFGGGHPTRNSLVRASVDKPSVERRLCQLLSLSTEDEKLTQAALEAARNSKRSATAAIISAVIAFLSFLAALVARCWPAQ